MTLRVNSWANNLTGNIIVSVWSQYDIFESRVGVVIDDVSHLDVDVLRPGRSWFCKELRFLLL